MNRRAMISKLKISHNLYLLGCNHSQPIDMDLLFSLKPTIFAVELCPHRRATPDIQSAMNFASARKIPVKLIDRPIYETCNRIFEELRENSCIRPVVKYSLFRNINESISTLIFHAQLDRKIPERFLRPSSKLISRHLGIDEAFQEELDIYSQKNSRDELYSRIEEYISSKSQSSPNPFSKNGVLAYDELCDDFGLDRILFKCVIKERDFYMAQRISELLTPEDVVVAVVGNDHIKGMHEYLSDPKTAPETFANEGYIPSPLDWAKFKILGKLFRVS
jgi:pheromone shutdown protein TraB